MPGKTNNILTSYLYLKSRSGAAFLFIHFFLLAAAFCNVNAGIKQLLHGKKYSCRRVS
jgi:hypothetical protein